MADEKTGLERREEDFDNNPQFGQAEGFGGADHILLTRSGTNKVTAGSRQSELRMAWLMFHRDLVAHDNVLDANGCGLNDHIKHYREEPDPEDPTKQRKTKVFFQIDYWKWMIEIIDDNVIEHQLTLWGYSRKEFIRHYIDIASINQREQQSPGMLQQLSAIFGRKEG
jgi:hypothetical protein